MLRYAQLDNKSQFNKEAVSLMLRMRLLIKSEFGEILPMHGDDAEARYCAYGLRSKRPELLNMARELAQAAGIPVPPAPPSGVTSPALVPPAVRTPAQPTPPPRLAQVVAAPTPVPPAPPAPVAARIANPVPAVPAPAPVADAAPAGSVNILTASLLDLLASDRFAQATRLLYTGIPALIIDKTRRWVLLSSTFKELAPLADVKASALRFETVPAEEWARLEKLLNRISLESFMWFCGLRFSQGQLLAALQSFRGFGLTRWPDFGVLPHDRIHIGMATFLSKKTGTLEQVIASTGASREQAISFINACFLCGWLKEVEPPAAAQAQPSSAGLGGLLGRIRARLGIG
ncbi:MAG: hypothetical protein U1F68_00940 [Gammaproteobacteria bacterium]